MLKRLRAAWPPLALATVLTVSSAAAAPPASIAGLSSAEVAAYVDGFVPPQLEKTGSPGAMVVVVDRQGNRWSRGYGYSDAARSRPMNPSRDMFRIASETKVLTALAILRQVEKGRLDLDDDAEKHLGGLKLRPRRSQPVTVRQLLQHAGGVSSISMAGSAVGWDQPLPRLSEALAVDTPRRERRPGVVTAYTNGSYTLLGRILETATGLDYHAAMQAEVFEPMGLTDATTNARTVERARLVQGVLLQPKPAVFDPAGTTTPPSGDAVMTPEQMGDFLQMMLNEGRLRDRTILSPALFERMTRDCFESNPYGDGICLGPRRDSYGRLSFLMHGGDYISQMSGWWVVPEKQIALWIGVNSNASFDEAFFAGFAHRFFPEETSAADPLLPPSPGRNSRDWAGVYRPNSSTMGGGGRFFDLLPPARDIVVNALDADRLDIGGLAYRRVAGDLFKREAGAAPDLDRVDVDSRKLARFLTGPDGETLLQLSGRSATRIPLWKTASINMNLLSGAWPALGLLGMFALATAIWRRWTGLALAAVGLIASAAGLLGYLILPQYGVTILYGFPWWIGAARVGFWIAAALALGAIVIDLKRPLRGPRGATVACALIVLAFIGWAACWGML